MLFLVAPDTAINVHQSIDQFHFGATVITLLYYGGTQCEMLLPTVIPSI